MDITHGVMQKQERGKMVSASTGKYATILLGGLLTVISVAYGFILSAMHTDAMDSIKHYRDDMSQRMENYKKETDERVKNYQIVISAEIQSLRDSSDRQNSDLRRLQDKVTEVDTTLKVLIVPALKEIKDEIRTKRPQ